MKRIVCSFCLISLIACAPSPPDETSPILLFNGAGASPGSVKAIEVLLQNAQLKYSTVNSRKLNHMDVQELMAHRLLIVPGGNYIRMGNNLTDGAVTNVHAAQSWHHTFTDPGNFPYACTFHPQMKGAIIVK